MQNPLQGVIVVISSPIATINLAPHVHKPAVIPTPPNNKRNHGVPVFGSTLLIWFYFCPDSPGRATLGKRSRFMSPHQNLAYLTAAMLTAIYRI